MRTRKPLYGSCHISNNVRKQQQNFILSVYVLSRESITRSEESMLGGSEPHDERSEKSVRILENLKTAADYYH